ncbi:hypothetical protein AB1K91_07050 [Terribacillus sp. 179-K 1B1 HS]|uniref:hypothetical protein n=1 Tax=Terribacillus sp. 179-K 1B1 HS TaxID=3142388 RepID=UPI0039A2014F
MSTKVYVNKSNLVKAEFQSDSNRYKVTDQGGSISYVKEQVFHYHFIEMKKTTCDYSYEEMAAGYASMIYLNQEEDDQYIIGTASRMHRSRK